MALPMRVAQGNVYDPFELAQREFDGMLGRFFNARGGDGGSAGLAPYGVDVREDQDHIYVEAEMPGFKKEDVDITLENNLLTIVAQRSEEKSNGNGQGQPQAQQAKGEYLLKERRFTRFQRSFSLPPTVDEQSVNARLDHGVLTIVLNKREETKPRKISVG